MNASWYFDFVSPFAYLQLPAVLEWRSRLSITPVPIVFGAVLQHHGQLGPAEIPGKRDFTYRFVQWQAQSQGRTLRFPPAHPFHSIAALRLCIAAGADWPAVIAVFDHLWRDGQSGVDARELSVLGSALGVADVASSLADDNVKAALRANTDGAIAAGVFGVPTLRVGDELFWGNDASAMIEERLRRGRPFADGEFARLAKLPIGVQRTR